MDEASSSNEGLEKPSILEQMFLFIVKAN
jgi:hypothetical protein